MRHAAPGFDRKHVGTLRGVIEFTQESEPVIAAFWKQGRGAERAPLDHPSRQYPLIASFKLSFAFEALSARTIKLRSIPSASNAPERIGYTQQRNSVGSAENVSEGDAGVLMTPGRT